MISHYIFRIFVRLARTTTSAILSTAMCVLALKPSYMQAYIFGMHTHWALRFKRHCNILFKQTIIWLYERYRTVIVRYPNCLLSKPFTD